VKALTGRPISIIIRAAMTGGGISTVTGTIFMPGTTAVTTDIMTGKKIFTGMEITMAGMSPVTITGGNRRILTAAQASTTSYREQAG